jgi:hypothetical protein
LLTDSDGLADVDLENVAATHRRCRTLATVTAVRPLSRFGRLTFESDIVIDCVEKPPNVFRVSVLFVLLGLDAASRGREQRRLLAAVLSVQSQRDGNVPDLNGLMSGIQRMLASGGVAVIEVPYVRDILVWNLKDEMVRQEETYHRRGGHFILAVPRIEIQ